MLAVPRSSLILTTVRVCGAIWITPLSGCKKLTPYPTWPCQGLEDHEDMFNQTTPEAIEAYLKDLGVKEMVIKCGSAGNTVSASMPRVTRAVVTYLSRQHLQVDSTAAGDSFADTFWLSSA